METRTFRSICTAALVSASLFALAGSAFAQDASAPPLVKDSKGDTLHMTCGQAHNLVHGTGGTLLTSGPNHYDLYHVGGGTCERLHQEMQPAFVRTSDTPLCFVGYTCEEPSSNGQQSN